MQKKILMSMVFLAMFVAGGGYAAWQNSAVQTWVQSRLPKAPDKEKLYEEALAKALEYKSQGDAGDSRGYERAISEYRKAARYSGSWFPYSNMGNVYVLTKEYAKAEEAYHIALQKKPDEVSVWTNLLDLMRYQLNRSPEQIVGQYKEAIKHAPQSPELHAQFGAYVRDIGRIPEAIEQFELLHSAYPSNPTYEQELKSLKSR